MKKSQSADVNGHLDFTKLELPNIFAQQDRMIEIPDYGEIGCGVVVPFSTEKKTIKISVPSNAHSDDVLFAHSVSGDSLNNPDPEKNICNGDSLICKANCDIQEITPDKICIVFVNQTCEKLAKKVIQNGDKVILRSTNPRFADRHFSIDTIEIKGIVIGFKRLRSSF